MSDEPAVEQDPMGIVYAAKDRRGILYNDDECSTWETMFCPLDKIVSLSVSKRFIAAGGGRHVAVSLLRHDSKVWQVVEVPGKVSELQLMGNEHVGERVYVAMKNGQVLCLELSHRPSLWERLGFVKTAPCIKMAGDR